MTLPPYLVEELEKGIQVAPPEASRLDQKLNLILQGTEEGVRPEGKFDLCRIQSLANTRSLSARPVTVWWLVVPGQSVAPGRSDAQGQAIADSLSAAIWHADSPSCQRPRQS